VHWVAVPEAMRARRANREEGGHGRDPASGRKRKGGAQRSKVLVFTATKVSSSCLLHCCIAAVIAVPPAI
jgi:hypothetical protein